MPIVDIGNGYEIDFPDTMSRDDINAAVHKTLGTTPVEKQLSSPTLGERVTAGAKAGGRSLYSAVLGIGQGALGLGDYAGAAGQQIGAAVRGGPVPSFNQAFETARAGREAIQAENPIQAVIGNIGGAVASGAAAAEALPSLLPRAGQAVGNVGRLMLGGEAIGGIQGGLENPQDAASGALSGAGIGGVAGSVGAGVAKGAAYVAKPAIAKAAAVLSKIMGEPPDIIARAIANFEPSAGRKPRAQDIMDLKQAGRLREMAGANPDLAAATVGANEASAAERGATFAARAAQGGTGSQAARETALQQSVPTDATGSPAAREAALTKEASARPAKSPVELQTALEEQANADFAAVRAKALNLTPEEIATIKSDILDVSGLTKTSRQRVLDSLENGELRGADFDLMRRRLGDIARAKPGEGAYEARGALLDIGSREGQIPEILTATANYRAGAERVAGAELGHRVLTEADTRGFLENVRRLSDAGREGLRLGAGNIVNNMASGSPAAGDRLATQLAANSGFRTRLQSVLGPEETQRLMQAANPISGAGVGERLLSETDNQAFAEAFNGLPPEGQAAAREASRNVLQNLSSSGKLADVAAKPGFAARTRMVLGTEADPIIRAGQNMTGAKLGARILTETDSGGFVEEFRKLPAEAQEHVKQAARSAFTDVANKGPDSAETLVQNIAANPGLALRMRAVLGQKEAEGLLRAAQTESAAATASNRATVLPRDRQNSGLFARGAQAAAGVAAAARGSLPAAGYHISEAARPAGKKLSGAVEKILSEWVQHPEGIQKAIAAMRAAGVREDKIRLVMQRVAAISGAAAGGAVQ